MNIGDKVKIEWSEVKPDMVGTYVTIASNGSFDMDFLDFADDYFQESFRIEEHINFRVVKSQLSF